MILRIVVFHIRNCSLKNVANRMHYFENLNLTVEV